ncbi:hypothetical protein F441_22422 [Phytophthora nicotianae CJ01A1]|uniref:Uncharacterized protein n=1 Tax=Phytophthora nicotianae CJ01A1 TaxID=1317063 RepID=W2VP73_PHYNI|nr:hypothetical protein F441_22422 [Phytophthora nicotianae CJ01A1]
MDYVGDLQRMRRELERMEITITEGELASTVLSNAVGVYPSVANEHTQRVSRLRSGYDKDQRVQDAVNLLLVAERTVREQQSRDRREERQGLQRHANLVTSRGGQHHQQSQQQRGGGKRRANNNGGNGGNKKHRSDEEIRKRREKIENATRSASLATSVAIGGRNAPNGSPPTERISGPWLDRCCAVSKTPRVWKIVAVLSFKMLLWNVLMQTGLRRTHCTLTLRASVRMVIAILQSILAMNCLLSLAETSRSAYYVLVTHNAKMRLLSTHRRRRRTTRMKTSVELVAYLLFVV